MEYVKKMIFTASAITLFITALLFVTPAAVFSQDVVAFIGEVSGEVIIVKSNPGEEIPAEIGALLGPGDTIKTGSGSFASVIFQDDGSRVKLGENAVLTLNVTRKQKKLNKRMRLDKGKLWAKVKKKRDTEFQINTPTSVASVKGTNFIIEEHVWGETWVWVLEGRVELSNGRRNIIINKGQKGTATKEKIDVGKTKVDDDLLEPGKHNLIFYLMHKDDPNLRKELHLNIKK